MTVYIDDMRAPFGRMLMHHMIADTTAELDAMAGKIGVARKWRQHSGTAQEHYDVCLQMRERALKLGAVAITWKQCAMMCANRRAHGELGDPATAATGPSRQELRAMLADAVRNTAAREPDVAIEKNSNRGAR